MLSLFACYLLPGNFTFDFASVGMQLAAAFLLLVNKVYGDQSAGAVEYADCLSAEG